MAWYWIVLIVLAALFGLLFLAYMTNADMKLIENVKIISVRTMQAYR